MIDRAFPDQNQGEPAPAKVIVAALWALAIAFQIQVTPTIFGSIIRVSLADLLSPLVLALIVWDSVRHRTLPRLAWRPPRLWLWLVAMTAAVTTSLIVGRIEIGQWFAWAVISKFAGWFVLLWYFLLAGWFVCKLGPRAHQGFAALLVQAFAVVAAADLLVRAIKLANPTAFTKVPLGHLRLQGLMENPNAYAFLAGVTLLFWLCLERRPRASVFYGVTTIQLAIIIMAASRGLWLALTLVAVLILCLFPSRRQGLLRPVVYAAPLAVALVTLISVMPTVDRYVDSGRSERTYPGSSAIILVPPSAMSELRIAGQDADVDYRITSNLEALRRWWESPLFGQGLGSFLWSQGQEVRADGFRPTIHNSLLWILAEMGLIGAVAFLGFFFLCLRALWPGRGKDDPEDESDAESSLQLASFLMLVLFAGMSLSTEILYQRHVWFLLGLALALRCASETRHSGISR